MPYNNFDVNKEQEKKNDLDEYIDDELQTIYIILDNVKEELNDGDYQEFVKELKESLGE
jgi:hypothetical protein